MTFLSESGNQQLTALLAGESMLVGRMGSTEAWVVCEFGNNDVSPLLKTQLSFIERLRIRRHAWLVAGIWPPTNRQLERFARDYVSAMQQCDVLIEWSAPEFMPMESSIASHLCKGAIRIPLKTLNLFKVVDEGEDPWIKVLEGKRVLVIHRETELIASQYLKRTELHRHFTLPNLKSLDVYQPPQTNGLSLGRRSWSRNLQQAKEELQELHNSRKFEFALVSAGAYGMPISSYLKTLGIPTVYVGGILQMYFGIWGSRWAKSESDLYKDSATSSWVWPSESSKPRGYKLIEGGSYW
jgi:hypothetical protein